MIKNPIARMKQIKGLMKMLPDNLSVLLEPISKKLPSGETMRYDDAYRKIHELRGSLNDLPGKVNYETIETLCVMLLKESTKDIYLVAILAEAWTHLYGLKGLNFGMELLLRVCEQFWDTLHPTITEDPEARVRVFEWVDTRLSESFLQIAITRPSISGFFSHTFAELIDARKIEDQIQKAGIYRHTLMQQIVNENRPTLESIARSADITADAFYDDILKEINSFEFTLDTLEEFLDKSLKDQAISLKTFDRYVSQIKVFIEDHLLSKQNNEKEVKPISVEPTLEVDEEEKTVSISTETLFSQLQQIAEQFEQIDPKSPVPKLIHKAIRWGQMSTTELLNDLAESGINISDINKILN